MKKKKATKEDKAKKDFFLKNSKIGHSKQLMQNERLQKDHEFFSV